MQTEKDSPIILRAKIIRIDERLSGFGQSGRFRSIDVRLDARLAASDHLAVPDGERAEGHADAHTQKTGVRQHAVIPVFVLPRKSRVVDIARHQIVQTHRFQLSHP